MPIPLAAAALGALRVGGTAAAGGAEAGAAAKFGGSALRMAGMNSMMNRVGGGGPQQAQQQGGPMGGQPLDIRSQAEGGFSGLLQTGQFH